MRRFVSLAAVLAALLLGHQAFAIAFWFTVAAPGTQMSAENTQQYGWPQGTLDVINHESRHYGWHFVFSECPNDDRTFGYTFKNTAQANDLIAKYAAIEHEPLALILALGPGPAVEMKKDVGCDARFRIRSQALLDQWYAALPTKTVGGVTVRVWGVHTYTAVPTAHPPMLSIYVDGERVRLGELKIPAGVPVSKYPPPKEADEKQLAEHEVLQKVVDKHEAARKRLDAQKSEDEHD